jgi:hypothetical protein
MITKANPDDDLYALCRALRAATSGAVPQHKYAALVVTLADAAKEASVSPRTIMLDLGRLREAA